MKKYCKENKIVTIIIIILIISLLVEVFTKSVPKHKLSATEQAEQTVTQITQELYKDPDNYFAITIPSSWNKIATYGNETKRTNIGQKTTKLELSVLSFQKNMGISILTYEGTPSCETVKKPNSKVAGLPAFYDPKQSMWIINTGNATYVITYHYPGVGLTHRPSKILPTPMPQFQLDANQNTINSILYTFKPLNIQPLQCPI